MSRSVDSYRFVDGMTRRVIKSWVRKEQARPIPWTPLSKAVSECRVALVSSAGVALNEDHPFDQQIERDNPWFADPSYRVIPQSASTGDLTLYHLHVEPTFFKQDMNCLLPIERLEELEKAGEIGRTAQSHFSYMGYTVQPGPLLENSVPSIVRQLREEAVDIVILVPS